MNKTRIEWCDYSWNVTSGCNGPNGARCSYCYMARMNRRFGRSFEPTTHPERLEEPLKLKKPSRIFVDSAGDLFDPAIPDEFIAEVIYSMTPGHWKREYNPTANHTYIVLTKQAARMAKFFSEYWYTHRTPCFGGRWASETEELYSYEWRNPYGCGEPGYCGCPWPLPHLWLGVTAEHQAAADERIPLLLKTPAAVRFVSVEPILGPVDLGLSAATCDCCERWPSRWIRLTKTVAPDWPLITQVPNDIARPGIYRAKSNPHGALSVNTLSGLLGIKPAEFECLPKLDWTIIGNDSTAGAEMPDPSWVQSLIDQCRTAGVPVWVKGKLHERFPITEWPKVAEGMPPS